MWCERRGEEVRKERRGLGPLVVAPHFSYVGTNMTTSEINVNLGKETGTPDAFFECFRRLIPMS